MGEFLAMASVLPSTMTRPQRKLALVIGIGNYEGDEKLDNPETDANDMSSMLEGIDFTVTKAVNLTRDAMDGHISTFKSQIQSGVLFCWWPDLYAEIWRRR